MPQHQNNNIDQTMNQQQPNQPSSSASNQIASILQNNSENLSELASRIIQVNLQLYQVRDNIKTLEELIVNHNLDVADIDREINTLTDRYYRWMIGANAINDSSLSHEEKEERKENHLKHLSIAIVQKHRMKFSRIREFESYENNLTIYRSEEHFLVLQLNQLLNEDYELTVSNQANNSMN